MQKKTQKNENEQKTGLVRLRIVFSVRAPRAQRETKPAHFNVL